MIRIARPEKEGRDPRGRVASGAAAPGGERRPGATPGTAGPGPYRLAIFLVIASSAINSVNGLLLRSIESATPWQIIAIRSAALAVALIGVFLVQQRREILSALRGVGSWGLFGAVAIGATNSGFVWAMSHTTIANAMFILSAVPFFTALLARVFLNERVDRGLWLAMGAALAGIGIMLGDGLGAGHFLGNALAVFSALGFACFVVILRRGRRTNMLPIVILGSLLSALSAAAMTGFDLAVPAGDLAIALVWGGVLSCVVHVLFVFGSRHVQGAELTLVVLLEFLLAPLWVWLAFAERPSVLTLAGGALVLLAVASRGVAALRAGEPAPLRRASGDRTHAASGALRGPAPPGPGRVAGISRRSRPGGRRGSRSTGSP